MLEISVGDVGISDFGSGIEAFGFELWSLGYSVFRMKRCNMG